LHVTTTATTRLTALVQNDPDEPVSEKKH